LAVFFTIEDAEELLPYLEAKLYELRDRVAMSQRTTHEIDSVLQNEINRIIKDIEDTGCILRDIELGIIDFPAVRRGRTVMLCWRLGEDRIRYWHEAEGGFTFRKRIRHSDFYTKRDMENLLFKNPEKEPLTTVERGRDAIIITIDSRGVPEHEISVTRRNGFLKIAWSWKGWEYSRSFHVGNNLEKMERFYRNGVLEVRVFKRLGR